MKNKIKFLLCILIPIALIGCRNASSFNESSIDDTSVKILAEDRNSDGKFDIFDSNNDGVLDIEEDALLSLDTGIDYPDVYLPDFELVDTNGIVYNLDSVKKYDITVICVWAYWCPDCFWELYGLTHMQDDDGNVYSFFEQMPDNVQWISLTTSGPDDYDAWLESVNTLSTYLHLPFNHVVSNSEETNQFVSSFRNLITQERDYTNTVPCVAIVDSNGYVLEVLYEQDGQTTAQEVLKYAENT